MPITPRAVGYAAFIGIFLHLLQGMQHLQAQNQFNKKVQVLFQGTANSHARTLRPLSNHNFLRGKAHAPSNQNKVVYCWWLVPKEFVPVHHIRGSIPVHSIYVIVADFSKFEAAPLLLLAHCNGMRNSRTNFYPLSYQYLLRVLQLSSSVVPILARAQVPL